MLARIGVLVAVAGLGAVALGPRIVADDLPVDAALVGTPARAVVRADRDYVVVDEVASESQRRLAAERTLPVWDFDDERARRDASVVQKALVRIAVALEAQRRATEAPASAASANARTTWEPLRAVVAGELADVGLDAPRDDAWRALLTVASVRPAALDVIATMLAVEFARPMVAVVPQTRLSSGMISVRTLSDPRDERLLDAREVVDEAGARTVARDTIRHALETATPAPVGTPATTWTGWAAVVATWASSLPRATLTWNAAETEARRRAARAAAPAVVVRAHRGEVVLRPGELVSERHVLLARAMAVQQGDHLRTRATLGTASFIALVCGVIYLVGARRVFQRQLQTRDVVFLGGLVAAQLTFLALVDAVAPHLAAAVPGLPTGVVAFAVPIAFGPMCARVTLPPDVALLLALTSALLGGVVLEPGMPWAVVAALSSMTGAALVTRGPRRWTILSAGVGAGVLGVGASLTLELFRGSFAGPDLLALLGATFAGGLLSGLLASICVPAIELAFGYVTDGRLYRLADLNHPLLKDLIVHAPDTWHHSVRVAVLAERTAAVVGAHVLLTRVMALYHDVGEMMLARPFAGSRDPIDRTARSHAEDRTTFLRRHIEEGLALGRQHRIPDAVVAAIEEHHAGRDGLPPDEPGDAVGTAKNGGEGRAVHFTGRPPCSRESALVMLADQIEAAARALDNPTGERLDEIVDEVINHALALDLLSACDLSLRDLGQARSALKASLRALQRGVVSNPLDVRSAEVS
jgi:putative nucleotidyltransferase with HDIG domain